MILYDLCACYKFCALSQQNLHQKEMVFYVFRFDACDSESLCTVRGLHLNAVRFGENSKINQNILNMFER